MAKSKRARVIPLTKVEKKPREWKEQLIRNIRESFDTYGDVYVIEAHNMTNWAWNQLRTQTRATSRLFMGKNQVMRFALGKSEEDSYRQRTWQLGRLLRGMTGLLFTNATRDELEKALAASKTNCSAVGGDIATETILIPKGPLDRDRYSFSLEPELRKLGLPTQLQNGIIHVMGDYTICQEGQQLTAAQARLLNHFGHSLGQRSLSIRGVWHKATEDLDILDEDCLGLLDESLDEAEEDSASP
ncbi:Ribosomal protein L10 [Giardia muris]|uniref:Ribosome assembly factor mrt4 n=1 Tax=Giardia muris TaxID=5742 RepID=A0A4Z1T0P9_GIAMU|nr:Ribosomal protein L10 [Giardia muris]|eukprot:TNJ29278.1 Ribosomal protein L10 [Giardia muris]